jgi:hypothetical protein
MEGSMIETNTIAKKPKKVKIITLRIIESEPFWPLKRFQFLCKAMHTWTAIANQ